MSTPVPKCCDMKMNLFGPALPFDVRRDIKGNPHAIHSVSTTRFQHQLGEQTQCAQGQYQYKRKDMR